MAKRTTKKSFRKKATKKKTLKKATRKKSAGKKVAEEPSEELFLGLVGAVGNDLKEFSEIISNQLLEYGYTTELITLTDIFQVIQDKSRYSSEYERIKEYMDEGNSIRRDSGHNDILVRHAMSKVFQFRENHGDRRMAYIFKSLKHHEEIKQLRQIYGESFYLIGLYSNLDKRFSTLVKVKRMSEEEANQLIERDLGEPIKHGQKLSKSYELSDVFIDGNKRNRMVSQSKRFIELLFGHPYHTPDPDEHNMFQAYAASLKSSDLSRQVGAIIVNKDGDIVSQGVNDVPKAQGGLYSNKDDIDERDFKQKCDSNAFQRNRIIEKIVEDVKSSSSTKLEFSTNHLDVLKEKLCQSDIQDLTEYGRAVHAEMEALLAAARIGISVRGGTLYTTTYPCHNCAKHIVAAGIMKVIYVEAYPKSRAKELHKDSISIDKLDGSRVSFLPFLGVGPRRYFDLFSLKLSSGREINRKDETGNVINFEAQKQNIALKLHERSNKYMEEEKSAEHLIKKYLEKKGVV